MAKSPGQEQNTAVDKSPPPSYTVDDENAVPDITAAFSALNLDTSSKPTGDQCIAHLKLLEAFHQLREDVAYRDGLFGVQDSLAQLESNQAELLTKIREKRWAIYVTNAVQRFERWWETMVEPGATMTTQANVSAVFEGNVKSLALDRAKLPPLGKPQ